VETRTEERGGRPAVVPRRRRGDHPTPRDYVRIAIVLGLITAAEVAVYYIEGARGFLVPLLFLFSFLKFTLVVLWFMHLKFDSRTYSRFFVMGLAGAITLYVIVLLSFGVFGR
jgi:cytochrome c oxidase subunit 4